MKPDELAAGTEPARPSKQPGNAARSAAPGSVVPADLMEVAPGFAKEKLQGLVWDTASEEALRAGLEKAFDYRGDVTITRTDGSKVEGYIFDRRPGKTLKDSFVRMIPAAKGSGPLTKVAVAYSEIAGLAFTGRDTAAGKSWEAWVKKYMEKKAAGEKNIELVPEKLD